MSPAKKLDVMHALLRQAYDLKSAAIRASEPDLIGLFIRPLEASSMKYMVTGGVISAEIIDNEELRSWIVGLELEGAFDAAVAYEE